MCGPQNKKLANELTSLESPEFSRENHRDSDDSSADSVIPGWVCRQGPKGVVTTSLALGREDMVESAQIVFKVSRLNCESSDALDLQKRTGQGSTVYLEGSLQTRQWTARDGQERSTTEVVLGGYDAKLVMIGGGQKGPEQPTSGSETDDQIDF